MTYPLLSVAIRHDHNTVAVRQRSRQVARLLGFDVQDQTRIATAVSEISRNAFRYAGGGRVEFFLEGRTAPQVFTIKVSDEGPGIPNLPEILDGRYSSRTGMGMGIIGARRLMDHFEIQSEQGRGTTVRLKKTLPRWVKEVNPQGIAILTQQLAAEEPKDLLAEVELQNQELLRTLEELRKRQDDLVRVNRELEDTNRGVVALYAELDEKADHLRRADELKSKFLSHMSHEFRSPLNSILALAGLLLNHSDGPINVEQTAQVGFIRRAAEDLYDLVNDLLDLAKVEAGKVEVKAAFFEIDQLFGALRGMLRPLVLGEAVSLTFEDCPGAPQLYSDEGKVSQILRNFLSNALKFTERGEVRVSARVLERRVRFSVADTGIGIKQEDQDRIFQDFSQIDSPLQRKVKGTGLGLPLSRKLAHLLGGEVSVSSEAGRGSVFSLEIPLAWPDSESAPRGASRAAATGISVLVLGSDAAAYSGWLRDTEFQASPAASVGTAQDIIVAAPPSLVVLNAAPDAWNLLTSLKNSRDTQAIRVVFAGAAADLPKAYGLGADDCLLQPVSRDTLLAALRRWNTGQPPGQVLIIDDDAHARYLLKYRLRGSGLQVIEADNGLEGIAKAIAFQPRLIFLDLRMPEMDGVQVLDCLKAHPRTHSIAVAIHTSLRMAERERDNLLQRAAAIISKNDLGQDLDTLIAQLGDAARLLSPALNLP